MRRSRSEPFRDFAWTSGLAGYSFGLAASLMRGCWLPAERVGTRERRCAPACLLEGEAGAGVHHRCAAGVDSRDDLLVVDPLQVGAGR